MGLFSFVTGSQMVVDSLTSLSKNVLNCKNCKSSPRILHKSWSIQCDDTLDFCLRYTFCRIKYGCFHIFSRTKNTPRFPAVFFSLAHRHFEYRSDPGESPGDEIVDRGLYSFPVSWLLKPRNELAFYVYSGNARLVTFVGLWDCFQL